MPGLRARGAWPKAFESNLARGHREKSVTRTLRPSRAVCPGWSGPPEPGVRRANSSMTARTPSE